MTKFRKNIEKRFKKFKFLSQNLSINEYFFIPRSYENVKTCWLAYPLILQNNLYNKRKEVQIFLEKAGIQARTIYTGNKMRQNVAQKFSWDSNSSFEVRNEVMSSGMILECHTRQSQENLYYLIEKIL